MTRLIFHMITAEPVWTRGAAALQTLSTRPCSLLRLVSAEPRFSTSQRCLRIKASWSACMPPIPLVAYHSREIVLSKPGPVALASQCGRPLDSTARWKDPGDGTGKLNCGLSWRCHLTVPPMLRRPFRTYDKWQHTRWERLAKSYTYFFFSLSSLTLVGRGGRIRWNWWEEKWGGRVPEIDQNLNGLQSAGGHQRQWWGGALV